MTWVIPKSVPELLLDAREFDLTKSRGYEKEDIIRASLECLRLCLPKPLIGTKVTLKCKKSDEEWLTEIVDQFNSTPRDKPFYKPAD